jgi:hypothetical protein
VPAALKIAASKDAGPPAPHLDEAALDALKAEMSGKSSAKPGIEAASAAGSVPLPDRKPH